VKCHTGNRGNVNLRFFHCKYISEFFSFSLSKTVNFTVKFYHIYLQYIVWKLSFNQLTVLLCSC